MEIPTMSERTHSPAAETTEVSSSPAGPNPPRFNAAQIRKIKYLVGGSALLAIAAAVFFQFFRGESGEAGTQRGGTQNGTQQRNVVTKSTQARVGRVLISWTDVADECYSRYGREILENIINRTIIQQACEKQNIVITKTEVDREVRRIAKKFNLPPDNWYQMLQAERNISPIQYRRDIIWPMLALKKIAGAKITITEEEIQRAWVSGYGPRVKAKMILLDNQRHADVVHKKAIRFPKDFGRLAQKYSIEPTSRALWGEIPPIRRFGGNKKLESVAFKLRKGEISPIITVGKSRYVILQCDGLTKPVVSSIEEVRELLVAEIREEKTQAAVSQVFNKLRRQTRVDNFLTGTRSGLPQASATSGSTGRARIRSYPPSSGTTRRAVPKID